MTRKRIKKLIKDITGKDAKVEYPLDPKFGDYSTNVAMTAKLDAHKIAAQLLDNSMFEKVEAVKPGFINFYLSSAYLQKQVGKIKIPNIGRGKRLQVEFISANPTGPLHIGNGRGAFFGDTLANVLEKVGFKVEREYYINDRGKQIEDLKKGLYKGETRTAKQIQKDNQRFIEKKLKIKFDNWVSEDSLYKKGKVKKIYNWLKKNKLVKKKQGAEWLKDSVIVRQTGEPTYFLSDIAYHKDKFDRNYKTIINIWGADHQGHVARMRQVAKILGYKGRLDILISQMVHLKGAKLSKRKGKVITLEWLIDEVGLDAARFFYLTKSLDTQMEFDVALAKERSAKSPVYYVQYAHARIHSILRKAQNNFQFSISNFQKISNFQFLNHTSELKLIKKLIKFPEVVEDIARDYQVQRLPQYAMDLATAFHQFYRDCRVLTEDKKTSQARLALVLGTKTILKNTLELMGISAPSKM